jgi:hypothetical protein
MRGRWQYEWHLTFQFQYPMFYLSLPNKPQQYSIEIERQSTKQIFRSHIIPPASRRTSPRFGLGPKLWSNINTMRQRHTPTLCTYKKMHSKSRARIVYIPTYTIHNTFCASSLYLHITQRIVYLLSTYLRLYACLYAYLQSRS